MHSRSKGNLGEDIAAKFLVNKGYFVVARNYQKAWGELDIVAEKDKILHFIEVKSLFVGSFDSDLDHSPEENVHGLKQRHMGRIIQTFIEDNNMGEMPFQVHVVTVLLNSKSRVARVKMIEDVVI